MRFLSTTVNSLSNIPENNTEKTNIVSSGGNARCFSNSGGFSYTSFSVICRSDGATGVIPQDVLNNLYFRYYTELVSPLFQRAIKNLLNTRKHLALQLDLEFGNISEEYFNSEEKTCLFEAEKIPFDKLREEVNLLFKLSKMALDSEEVSGILNCPVDDAEKAIRNLLLKD